MSVEILKKHFIAKLAITLMIATAPLISSCTSKINVDLNYSALIKNAYALQNQGSLNSTNIVKIKGEGLDNLLLVTIGNYSCEITVKSSTEATCELNANLEANWYDITLLDKNKTEIKIRRGYAAGALVIGQSSLSNPTASETSGGDNYSNLNVIDGMLLAFADSFQGRRAIVKWDSVPTSHVSPSGVLLGKKDFLFEGHDAFLRKEVSTNSYTVLSPSSSCKMGDKFIMVDAGLHRLMIYPKTPSSWLETPEFVLGQPDFNTVNATTTSSGLFGPRQVYCDHSRIILADSGNNRVLIWNSPITRNGQDADVVIGQSDFVSGLANQGGTASAFSLRNPLGVYSDGTRLFITDSANNRILIYHNIPTTNGAAADLVLGQPNMTTVGSATSSVKLASPRNTFLGTNYLWVSDTANNRILGWNLSSSISTWSDGKAADIVLGQDNFTTKLPNRGGAISLLTMRYPMSILEHAGQLFVSDFYNARILAWNSIPSVNGEAASFQLGQNDDTKGDNLPQLVSDKSFANAIEAVTTSDNKIFVLDSQANRLLRFPLPTENNPQADLLIGQPDFYTALFDGKPDVLIPSAATFRYPSSIYYDHLDNSLFVIDSASNRVLVWNSAPTSNNQPADIILGQLNATTAGGGSTASKMYNPRSVCRAGNDLYVSEAGNHRILRFSYPLSTGMAANLVLGQPDFTSNGKNAGGEPNANTLYQPLQLYCDSTKLMVSDTLNNRILIWSPLPNSNNQAANVVLGQNDFNSTTPGIGANRLNVPRGIAYKNGRLLVTDMNNNRILIWNSLPTTNGSPADDLIGQVDFNSNTSGMGKQDRLPGVSITQYLNINFLDENRILVNVQHFGVLILPLPKR